MAISSIVNVENLSSSCSFKPSLALSCPLSVKIPIPKKTHDLPQVLLGRVLEPCANNKADISRLATGAVRTPGVWGGGGVQKGKGLVSADLRRLCLWED